jgi:hypothetical protein
LAGLAAFAVHETVQHTALFHSGLVAHDSACHEPETISVGLHKIIPPNEVGIPSDANIWCSRAFETSGEAGVTGSKFI